MISDCIATIQFALYPDTCLRLALFHNIPIPSSTLNTIQQNHELRDRLTILDASNVVSLRHMAIAANVALQRNHDVNTSSIEDRINQDFKDGQPSRNGVSIIKEILACLGGGTHVQHAIADFLFEQVDNSWRQDEMKIDCDKLYSVIVLGINFSSPEVFASKLHHLSFALDKAESISSMVGYFSRIRSELEIQALCRIYKLNIKEIPMNNHESLENAIITRIATKFYT